MSCARSTCHANALHVMRTLCMSCARSACHAHALTYAKKNYTKEADWYWFIKCYHNLKNRKWFICLEPNEPCPILASSKPVNEPCPILASSNPVNEPCPILTSSDPVNEPTPIITSSNPTSRLSIRPTCQGNDACRSAYSVYSMSSLTWCHEVTSSVRVFHELLDMVTRTHEFSLCIPWAPWHGDMKSPVQSVYSMSSLTWWHEVTSSVRVFHELLHMVRSAQH